MLKAQVHRGPDDEGSAILSVGPAVVGLGSRRLAILDVSPLGHQPMANPETGDTLVHNGEIYDFLEVRQVLETAGYSFRSRSDTEVILRSYQHWGMKCFEQLKGMFAFALWDSGRSRLVLARDHLGMKPLYYMFLPGGGFVFASEIRALLSSGLVPLAVGPGALASYLAYGAVQEPLSIIQGVSSLPPGSWMEVDARGEKAAEAPHWEFPRPSRNHSARDLIEEGQARLQRAIRRHLLSDVPLGVFLSSGLDSTAVLGVAQKLSPNQIHAFTVSFPDDPAYDEAPIARETAKRFGVVHHVYQVDAKTACQWGREGLDHMDQPAMDGLNTYIVSRAVREQGIVVALSGQGGDELFGGYRSYRGVPRWLRRMFWARLLPPLLRTRLVRIATRGTDSVFRERAADIARAGRDLLGIYFHYRRLLSDDDLSRLGMKPAALGLTGSFHLPSSNGSQCLIPQDPIASVARLETNFYLRNTLLRDGDVFGMANSLEIRLPLLDRDLVEWTFGLPGGTLLPPGAPNKSLLRQMCAEFYSEAQVDQPKRGFSLPFSTWLLGPLRELMEECLDSLKASGLVDPEGVERLREVFVKEPNGPAWAQVWCLVALSYWLKRNAVQPTLSSRI